MQSSKRAGGTPSNPYKLDGHPLEAARVTVHKRIVKNDERDHTALVQKVGERQASENCDLFPRAHTEGLEGFVLTVAP